MYFVYVYIMGSTLHQPPAVYFMGKDLFYIQEMVYSKDGTAWIFFFTFFLYYLTEKEKLNMKSFLLMKFIRFS